MDLFGVAHEVDAVDHAVADRRQRAVAVAGLVVGSDLGHLVAVAGPLEVGCVGVDHRVGEQVASGVVDPVAALAHAGVDVGVDRGRRAGQLAAAPGRPLPDLVDRPGHVRGGQVVEQHAVGHLAGQAQHARVERADDDLGSALAQAHAEAEAADLVEVAGERDRLAAQAQPQQRDVLADPGQRVLAVGRAVPALGDHRRRDADAEDDVAVGMQGLQGGAGHRDQGRGAQLQGQHAGAQAERRRHRAGRGQHREGLGADRLGRPERAGSRAPRPSGRCRGRRRGPGS